MTLRLFPSARRIGAAFALFAALVCCSCGKGPQRLPVFPVKGRVMLGTRPAAGAMVVFHPVSGLAADAKLRPVAAVQDDGTFEAHTYDYKDGLPAGEYAVTVHWNRPAGKNGEDEGGGSVSMVAPKYEKPETSGIKVTVGEHPNELPPITLAR